MNNLKQWRESKGLSQLELGRKLGFGSAQFISNIERGLSQLPSKHFKTLTKVLGVSTDKLISWKMAQSEARLRDALRPKK